MTNYHLTAQEVMQTEVATILADATVQEAAALMRYEGVRSLLILPREGETNYGIVTFSDIVNKVLAERGDPARMLVDDISHPNTQVLAPSSSVQDIANLFRQHKIGHAPVVDADGNLLGIVSMTDLITEVITEPE